MIGLRLWGEDGSRISNLHSEVFKEEGSINVFPTQGYKFKEFSYSPPKGTQLVYYVIPSEEPPLSKIGHPLDVITTSSGFKYRYSPLWGSDENYNYHKTRCVIVYGYFNE